VLKDFKNCLNDGLKKRKINGQPKVVLSLGGRSLILARSLIGLTTCQGPVKDLRMIGKLLTVYSFYHGFMHKNDIFAGRKEHKSMVYGRG
jgi:hypothetical protein